MRRKRYVCELITLMSLVIFFCEFLFYYIVISQCSWPLLKKELSDDTVEVETDNTEAVRALFIADIHLLGPVNGHWLDKLRREWQMYRSFQTAVTILKPDLVFILGDLFHEGFQSSDTEFHYHVNKLKSLFVVPENIKVFVVPGDNDIGLHYHITPHLHDRFMTTLMSPPVQMVALRGNYFVLINSMAMEGDGCFICRLTQIELSKIAMKLRCAKGIGKCPLKKNLTQFSRPILLQHFPMYRDSDRQCSEPDQAPEDIKKQEFRERWNCLSKEASEMIYDNLKPRVIIGGHTHHGCHLIHREDIHEYTLPSFNWRNKNNPSFMMGVFLPNNFVLSKCYIPQETTVILLYFLGCVLTLFLMITLYVYRKLRININIYKKCM